MLSVSSTSNESKIFLATSNLPSILSFIQYSLGKMVRNWKRKTDKGSFTETQMKNAQSLVMNDGISIRESARIAGVKKTTLCSYLRKVKSNPQHESIRLCPNYTHRRIFTDAEESALSEYVVNCSKMNFGLTRRDILKLACEFALKNGKVFPNNWRISQMAEVDWLFGFMKRNPQLSLRKPEACSLSRSTAFNKHNASVFF